MAIRLLLMAGAPAVPDLHGGADVDRSTSQPAKWKGMCCCHEKTLHVVCTVASVYLRLLPCLCCSNGRHKTTAGDMPNLTLLQTPQLTSSRTCYKLYRADSFLKHS